MTTTNIYASTIIDNRFIGKVQLTSDDLGGGTTWIQYRTLCDNIVFAAYNRLSGKSVDENILGASVAALFSFFEVDAKATPAYTSRLLAATITRKSNRSKALKDASKDMRDAKTAWEKAIVDEKSESEIAELENTYNEKKDIVDKLYTEPNNFWYDLIPMLDKNRLHATAQARKAIEDVIADIINERELMTVEELQAEARRLEDERKGRAIRKKNEAKKNANK